MTCREALRLLEFARPGATELDAADIGALERHLADCRACAAFAAVEAHEAGQIERALRSVQPPDGAQSRLLSRLSTLRRQWWQKSFTIAAGVIGICTGGWWLYPAPRYDPEAVVFAAQDQVGNREAADEWLRGQDRRFQFPPKLRGQHLVSYERRDFHGARAPVLTFARGGAVARVAVLTSGQFRNLSALGTGRQAENSACTVLIIRDPERPDVVYVVEVSNGPVEPFLTEDEASVT